MNKDKHTCAIVTIPAQILLLHFVIEATTAFNSEEGCVVRAVIKGRTVDGHRM